MLVSNIRGRVGGHGRQAMVLVLVYCTYTEWVIYPCNT